MLLYAIMKSGGCMKKLYKYILALLCVWLVSCGAKKAQEEPITLVMAEVNGSDTVTGRMDSAFKDKVEELSHGNIKIDLRFDGTLGDEKQVMEIMLGEHSSIQLARISASLASYGGKKSKLITIPFTFNGSEHFWKFAKSDIAKEILLESYDMGLGVRGLFYGEEGFRHFFSVNPINSIDDMKGKNIRASNSKVLKDLETSLGGTPVVVDMTGLFASMQTGKIDIAEQPLGPYLSNKLYTVAPYMILDGHMLGAVQVLIDSTTWDNLSENQQNILNAAGEYASDYCRQIVNESDKETMNKLKEQGVTFVEVKDYTAWQEACKNMRQESASDFAELYQKIIDIGK